MTDLLEIEALGGLRIRRGGAVVADLGSRKAEALLVYLARSRRPQPREVLADLLWDERSTVQALNNLRVLLTRLGKQFAPYLRIARASVAFYLDSPHWLDVAELEEALDGARARRTRGDALSPVAVRDMERAIALYSGPFLQGFHLRDSTGFEDWMLREQDRLQGRVATTLHDLITYYLERGEYPEGIQHSIHLLELDPLHEETHRQLMLLLVLSGQRRAALEHYETCRRTLAAELGTEPSPATTELYEQIRAGQYPGAEVRPPEVRERRDGIRRPLRPEYLPHALTPFIGREEELKELAAYLADSECPLITLVGPGGSGKSRLAVQASHAAPGFLDGVYFVPLASVNDPAFIVPTIADALQLTFSGTHKLEDQLFGYLKEKEMLLMLDNFEHLLAGADLLPRLLQAAPDVKLLVTSRESLNLAAEQLFDVTGLPVPAPGEIEGIESYHSVELFLQRARRAQPRFEGNMDVRPWIARICQLVEGLPLGLELAAVWVRERSCEEIATELERNLDLLATTQRDVPARHRSVRAVFDQSWNLLSAEEQRVLAEASVFRGGFDLEAATQIMHADRALLARLVRHSLLRQTPSGRYDMHELLKQYAAQKLAERQEETEVHHGAYFMGLAQESFNEMMGPRQVEWSNRLELEHDNMRASLSRAIQRGDTKLALLTVSGLQRFWYFRAYLNESKVWLERVLALPDDAPDLLRRAKVLNALGVILREQGDLEGTMKALDESVQLMRIVGERLLVCGPLGNMALVARDMGDYDRAEALAHEALELRREQGDEPNIALQLYVIGKIALWRGDVVRAKTLVEESLAMFRSLADTRGTALTLTCLGQIAREAGDFHDAAIMFKEGLTRYPEVGDRRGIADCFEGLAEVNATQSLDPQNAERAAMLLGAASLLREVTGSLPAPIDRKHVESSITNTRHRLGVVAWEAANSKGRHMSSEAAIARAMDTPIPRVENT